MYERAGFYQISLLRNMPASRQQILLKSKLIVIKLMLFWLNVGYIVTTCWNVALMHKRLLIRKLGS